MAGMQGVPVGGLGCSGGSDRDGVAEVGMKKDRVEKAGVAEACG